MRHLLSYLHFPVRVPGHLGASSRTDSVYCHLKRIIDQMRNFLNPLAANDKYSRHWKFDLYTVLDP